MNFIEVMLIPELYKNCSAKTEKPPSVIDGILQEQSDVQSIRYPPFISSHDANPTRVIRWADQRRLEYTTAAVVSPIDAPEAVRITGRGARGIVLTHGTLGRILCHELR